MPKTVILTGLRANNELHLGNYFGALLPLVKLARQKAGEYQFNLFVPDLHSFTTPIDHSRLQAQIKQNLRLFTAAGLPLDHPDVHIYRQSYIAAHSELTWVLDCFTGMGEMTRMTQYKDKSGALKSDRITVGLFNYPVLMAADILLYDANYVPVGDDQTQHLEFARDIAERLNNRFGRLFTVPEPVAEQHRFFNQGQALRLRDLVDPEKKMSKSAATGKGVIFLTDQPAAAAQKLLASTTDSLNHIAYDYIHQPGVSNLLDILALLSATDITAIRQQYEGQSQYGPLKAAAAAAVTAFLTDFQARLAAVDDNLILQKLTASEKIMNRQAKTVLSRVQTAVGLRP